jgi:hypothetical protein
VAGGIVDQAKDVGERVVEAGGRAVDAVTDVLPGGGSSS